MPMGDMGSAQGDVNHLNMHQLLKIRVAEADFKSKASMHDAHNAFLEKVEKVIVKTFVDAACKHPDKPQPPPEKDSISEAIMLSFASSHEFKFHNGDASNWWACVVGDFKILYINVDTLEVAWKRPKSSFNVYRDYSKAGGAGKLYDIQVIELPLRMPDEHVIQILAGNQIAAESLMADLFANKDFA